MVAIKGHKYHIKSLSETKNTTIILFSDTTVTVSIAAVPNYTAVKSEVPGHGFSVSVPNGCAETDSHVSVFERQLAHTGVQFSPSTQSRTPPDSTFSESFKDTSQEVCVIVCVCVCVCPTLETLLKPPSRPPALPSSPLTRLDRHTKGHSPDPCMEPAVGLVLFEHGKKKKKNSDQRCYYAIVSATQ